MLRKGHFQNLLAVFKIAICKKENLQSLQTSVQTTFGPVTQGRRVTFGATARSQRLDSQNLRHYFFSVERPRSLILKLNIV